MTKEGQRQARRILIAGAPGSGRRTVGTLLELERGFRHVRVGSHAPADGVLEALATPQDSNVVVSWTAPLDHDTLEWLHLSGFEFVRLGPAGNLHGWRTVDPRRSPREVVVDVLTGRVSCGHALRRQNRAVRRSRRFRGFSCVGA